MVIVTIAGIVTYTPKSAVLFIHSFIMPVHKGTAKISRNIATKYSIYVVILHQLSNQLTLKKASHSHVHTGVIGKIIPILGMRYAVVKLMWIQYAIIKVITCTMYEVARPSSMALSSFLYFAIFAPFFNLLINVALK